MKYICALLVMALLLSLCACGGDPAVSDSAPSTTTTAPTTTTTEATTTTSVETTTSTTEQTTNATTTAVTTTTTTMATTVTPTGTGAKKPTLHLWSTTAPVETTAHHSVTTLSLDDRVWDSIRMGDICLYFTIEATQQYAYGSCSADVLSQRLGIEIESVKKLDKMLEKDKNGKETGRYYRYVVITIPQKDKEAMVLAMEKLNQHQDILCASPYIVNSFPDGKD